MSIGNSIYDFWVFRVMAVCYEWRAVRNVDHNENSKRTTRWRNSSSRNHEWTELGKDMEHQLEGFGGPHKKIDLCCINLHLKEH